jgi:hypothetical protein
MSRAKQVRKFATVKRQIKQRDSRLKKNQLTTDEAQKKQKSDQVIREMYEMTSHTPKQPWQN